MSLRTLWMLMPALIAIGCLSLAGSSLSAPKGKEPTPRGSQEFYPGDYTQKGVLGRSLPGWWRPFSDDSPWNREIPSNARTHPDSAHIMRYAVTEATHLRLPNIYSVPLWVVNSDNVPHRKVRSDKIYDDWDRDRDGWSDIGVPLTQEMWAEPTVDGHLCVIDPFKKIAWEFSKFRFLGDGTPSCTTFNVWDLAGTGVAKPFEGERWWARGGRGSGFPLIAGIVRPEELAAGEIRHALIFSMPRNRKSDEGKTMIVPPASRSDARYKGQQYPVEGMLFQLDPRLTEKDFDRWGLGREARVLARALQKYGMYLCDNGGAMVVLVQLLGPSREENRKRWERLFPGFYENVKRIPANRFRVVYTGETLTKDEASLMTAMSAAPGD